MRYKRLLLASAMLFAGGAATALAKVAIGLGVAALGLAVVMLTERERVRAVAGLYGALGAVMAEKAKGEKPDD